MFLWKILVGDKLYPMKLAARVLLTALTISIGSLTPILPRETSLAISHKASCCVDMNTGGCHGCLTNTGETNSGLGSTCCTAQSVCLLVYLTSATSFVTEVQMIGTLGVISERATARGQRPPVPPPRIASS